MNIHDGESGLEEDLKKKKKSIDFRQADKYRLAISFTARNDNNNHEEIGLVK